MTAEKMTEPIHTHTDKQQRQKKNTIERTKNETSTQGYNDASSNQMNIHLYVFKIMFYGEIKRKKDEKI